MRLAAMKLIALGRQGKLAYVLSENLHDTDEALSKAATEAMVALARWVATETRALQRGGRDAPGEDRANKADDRETMASRVDGTQAAALHAKFAYAALLENRADIE